MDGSSLGNAPAKQKSIDVGFNLLQSWSETRVARERKTLQRVGLAIGLVIIGVAAFPFLFGVRESAVKASIKAQAALDRARSEAEALDAKAKLEVPRIESKAMREASQRRLDVTLGHLAHVLNAAPGSVRLDNLNLTIAGGQVRISLAAQAFDARSARAFVREAGKGRSVVSSSQKGARRSMMSGARGGAGIAFDYERVAGDGL